MGVQAHASLLTSLRGQTIEVPDLSKKFAGWANSINPLYHKMIPLVDRKLESLMSDPSKLSKLKSADFALFAAAWWPRAAWNELVTLTYLTIWLFVWDDEIDMAVGDLSLHFDKAQIFRLETVAFITYALGFGKSKVQPQAPNPIINSFKVIADSLCNAYNQEQLGVFLHEMTFFLEMSQLEQEYRLNDRIPAVEQYWVCRLGTSAVGPCMAMVAFSTKQELPGWVMASAEMQTIWEETNIIISIVNDILSLKKELATGCIFSVIPLSCVQSRDVQLAVDQALEDLDRRVERLEAAASALIEGARETPEVIETLRSYVDVCKENCTGNLHWSFCTGRYGLVDERGENGGVRIVL